MKNFLLAVAILVVLLTTAYFIPSQATEPSVTSSLQNPTTTTTLESPHLVNEPRQATEKGYLPLVQKDGLKPTATVAKQDESELPQLYVVEPGFAYVRPPVESFSVVEWGPITITTVVDGKAVTKTVTVPTVTDTHCNGSSIIDNVKKVYAAFKSLGVPWRVIGAMVYTESLFQQFEYGPDGKCRMTQNHQGFPAYCMMQIYLPAHPKVKKEDLTNIDYCIQVGLAVYRSMLTNHKDPIQAVACYKGFCSAGYAGKNDPSFIRNFQKTYESAGFKVDNIFVPLDEKEFLQLFPELKK